MRAHLRCPIALLLVLGLPLLVSCGSGGGATAPTTTPAPSVPANPTGFVLVASTASGLSLKWDATSGAATYTLERKSGSVAYAKVIDTAATTFDDSGLAADTDYAYRLKAVNAAGSSTGVELNARTAKVAAPTLASFTPASGSVGTVVTLTGTNLSGTTAVSFNGVAAATLTNITASSLQATVPTGATTGKITVTTPGGTATSATNFTVSTAPVAAPTLSSFTPASGGVGTVVTLTGTNLSGTTAVSFNGVTAATLTNITASSLQATVPTGATTGKITVTTPGGTATSANVFTLTGGTGIPQIGAWKERILNGDGSINWTEWEYVANHYHTAEVLDWRLGPRHTDYHPGAGDTGFPTVYQPEPNGLWKGGLDKGLADRFCVTSEKLPHSDVEEKAIFDEGGGWQLSGQLLFAPDPTAPAEFLAGSANTRAFDGAMARKRINGVMVTQALCMRMNASWYGDWWNRNNISTPTTPSISRVLQQYPGTPLPAIATARGQVQSSITGFLAFQNGVIAAAGTGNDPYCNGFGTGTPCEPMIKLPVGKVPTALALTAMNEFLLATVWDVNAKKGQLAVIAVGPEDPANIGPADTGRYGWGVQSWPTIHGLKLLGFVDLPMAAPNTLSVALNTGSGKFRGYNTWRGSELLTQAGRDDWNTRSLAGLDTWFPLLETQWKYLAGAGYAVVGSRAENKVALVDLRPLLGYYREMYLTTEERWKQTADSNQGPDAGQWPYNFDFAPQQRPVVLGTLPIDQPTAVLAWQRRWGTNTKSGWDNNDWNALSKTVTIAAMDGTVRQFEVTSLIDPARTPVMPSNPVRTWTVGSNPIQIATPIAGAARTDDLYFACRGTREISVHGYKGTAIGVLKDVRLQDPVALSIGPNGAGYFGAGTNYAFAAQALTVLDYSGKTVHVYGMRMDNYDIGGFQQEQWPFRGPNGESQQFQYGSGRTLPGKPFAYTIDEVI